jgi:uncharacterized protein (UPF0335 family)
MANELIGFVEQYEAIAREKAALKLREKSLDRQATLRGLDAPTIKRVVTARLKSAEQIEAEQKARAKKEQLYEIYCASLGMLEGTPLGDAAREWLAKEFKKGPEPERAKKASGAAAKKHREPAEAAAPPAPDTTKSVSPEEISAARDAGEAAHTSGVSVLRNPYTAGDPRRAAWDEGWCSAAGSDGMGIPKAYQRKKGKKGDDEPPARAGGRSEGAPAQ